MHSLKKSCLGIFYHLSVLALIPMIGCSTQQESSRVKEFEVHTGQEKLTIKTSDSVLAARFEWAGKQALSYAHNGEDPVGRWYEAALPNREAFCMRDVSHQSVGAHLLGLDEHNKNMMKKFAANISESKDWCTYWEINRYDQPAPVDYRNDNEFWYNLPANFDVLNSCYLLYQWTGDPDYVKDPVLVNFYQKTVYDYVERWDLDIETIMTRDRFINLDVPLDTGDTFHVCRGLPGYGEGDPLGLYLGGDLLNLQYLGYKAYSEIQEILSNKGEAEKFSRKAKDLKSFYNDRWWDPDAGRYFTSLHTDGQFKSHPSRYLLASGIGLQESRFERALQDLLEAKHVNIESRSYFPLLFYQYGQNQEAYHTIMELSSPNMERREYPEVSFAIIEALVGGAMGIEANSTAYRVNTLPHLTTETEWLEFENIPIFHNKITIRHQGNSSTTLTNQKGERISWKPGFRGKFEYLLVGENEVKTRMEKTPSGKDISTAFINVEPGQSVTARIPLRK